MSGYAFVAARLPGSGALYFLGPTGWAAYDAANPLAYAAGNQAALSIPLASGDLTAIVGAQIYLGYGLGSTAQASFDDMLKRGLFALAYTVQ